MVNATPPSIPLASLNVLDAAILGHPPAPPEPFEQQWFQFLNNSRNFMLAVRAWPQQVPQAQLAQLGVKLEQGTAGTPDMTGVIVWEPTYNHLLRWTGSAWTFAPSDIGSGFTQAFLSVPTAVGWVLCSGQTVSFLKADGTLGSQVLPNTAGLYFRI